MWSIAAIGECDLVLLLVHLQSLEQPVILDNPSLPPCRTAQRTPDSSPNADLAGFLIKLELSMEANQEVRKAAER